MTVPVATQLGHPHPASLGSAGTKPTKPSTRRAANHRHRFRGHGSTRHDLGAGCGGVRAACSQDQSLDIQPSSDTSTLWSCDWSGHRVGTVHTAIPIPCCVFSQSPDGSRISDGIHVLDGKGGLLYSTRDVRFMPSLV